MARVTRSAVAVGCGLVALAAAGCGDDNSSGSAGDLASLVPAAAPLYGESVIRPEGEERETIERVISAVTGEDDPGAYVVEKLDEVASEGQGDFSYSEDIEPWLGERVAVFYPDVDSLLDEGGSPDASACIAPDATADLGDIPPGETVDSCVGGDESDNVVFLLETTDSDAARAAVEKAAAQDEDDPAKDASYEGVDYLVDSKGMAAGIVDGFLVAGTEDGLKAAVDTAAGADSLAGSEELSSTLADLGESPTASLYVDAPALIAAASKRGDIDAETRAGLDLTFGGRVTEAPVGLGAEIDAGGIALTSSTAAPAEAIGLAQSALLDDVPADAWVASGASDVGGRVAGYLGALADAAPGQFDKGAIEEMFRREAGFELRELYEPLGDLSIYVSGTSPFDLQGAAAIETDDPDASAEVLDSLARLAARDGEPVERLDVPGLEEATGFSLQPEGAPGSVHAFVAGDRIVIAYGDDAAVEAAGAPAGDTLTRSPDWRAAGDALGEGYEVGTYVDAEAVAELAGSIPIPAGEVTGEQIADALDVFDFLVTGAQVDGDRRLDRLVIGLDG